MTSTRYGTYTTSEDRPTLSFERRLSHTAQAGWHVCLDRLEELLGGGHGPAMTGVSEDWRGLYEAYRGRGVPAGAPISGE